MKCAARIVSELCTYQKFGKVLIGYLEEFGAMELGDHELEDSVSLGLGHPYYLIIE